MRRCVWPKIVEEFGGRKWLAVGLEEGHLGLWTMFHLSKSHMQLVRAKNEINGSNFTWAHNLFMRWVFGFPTLGRSQYRDLK